VTAPARLGPASVREFPIADNDFGGNVGFEATLYTATEGGTVDVAIVRTGGAGTVLIVGWQAGLGSASPGVDFTPASGSVTFGPNDTRKTFTISTLTDAVTEDPETVALTLSVPEGAATLGRATTTLRILDAPR
jgi:Calx-beta domain